MKWKFSISQIFDESPDKIFKISVMLMALLTLIIYGQSISYDYAVDDAIVITENMYVQEGLKGIPDLWTHDTFHGFFKESGKENLVAGGRYRPWTPTLFTIERVIFGQAPWIGHLLNVISYIIATFLMMWSMRQLMRKKMGEKGATYIAAVAGILYAVHPVHTEVVANIKGADEVWVLLASFAALCFMISEKLPDIWRGVGTFIFAFIAMTSKENAMFLLLILPLYYQWSQDIKWTTVIKRAFPILLAIGLALILRTSILGLSTADRSMELLNNPFLKWNGNTYIPFDTSERIGTVFSSLLTYLRLFIWPHPLTHDYYPQQIARVDIFHWRSLLSLLLYGAMTVWMVLSFKKNRFVSLGIALFLLTLLPVSNLLFPIGTLASERFLFIPSIGLIFVLGHLLWNTSPPRRKIYTYLSLLIVILFTILAFLRTQVWKDNYTLFLTDVNTSTASAKVHNAAAGEVLLLAGEAPDEETQEELARQGFQYANRAIELHPTYKNAYLLRGNSYLYQKQFDNALADYNRALSYDPGFADAINNKFLCLRIGGRHFGEVENNLAKSESYLRQALNIRPDDYEALRLMGINQGVQRKNRQAILYFKKALNVSREGISGDILKNLSIAYEKIGKQDSSLYYLQLYNQLEAQKE